jgi:hypothetical protein
MNPPPLPPSTPALPDFPRRLLRLILVMLLAVAGLFSLLFIIQPAAPVLVQGLCLLVLALTAGLSSRWLFRRQPVPVRLITALLDQAAGSALLAALAGWRLVPASLSSFKDWLGWQTLPILLAAPVVCLLALFAWTPRWHPAGSSAMVKPQAVPHDRKPAARRAKSQHVRTGLAHGRALIARRKKSLRRVRLHLSPQVEHRCPYCLELIDPSDKRGAVECQVCHTLHHADCWAAAGACQVPHYTA